MFGRRGNSSPGEVEFRPAAPAMEAQATAPQAAAAPRPTGPISNARDVSTFVEKEAPRAQTTKKESYYDTKSQVFSALIDTIDLSQLAKLDAENAREEIRDIVNDIISIKNLVMSISDQEELLEDICNDVLGYGPLEPLLARDDIADIMVNGANHVFIEVSGKVQETQVRFRDNQQLLNICQRIVSQVGRRVDESSPICDARLPDGSRVNAVIAPLALDGASLSIRKFSVRPLSLFDLVRNASMTPEIAELLQGVVKAKLNTIISGGTGSGKIGRAHV